MISHHNDALRQNVALMENLNKEGIKLADLNTDKLVGIISRVEKLKREQNMQLRRLDPSVRGSKDLNRPFIIWNILHKHFGQDFFLEVIEEEYGITPHANQILELKMTEHFETSVNNYKTKLAALEDHYKGQIETL